MKVAIAIWKDRVSPVFDVSRKILVLDIENNAVAKEAFEVFENDNLIYMASRLKRLNIETLICGAISNPLFEMIISQGIQIIPFACGCKNEVVCAFLNNALPDPKLSMPGCCGFRQRALGRNNIKKMEHKKGGKIMPKGDGTGPNGQGSNNPKGKGKCGSKGQPKNSAKNGGCRKGGQGKGGKQA